MRISTKIKSPTKIRFLNQLSGLSLSKFSYILGCTIALLTMTANAQIPDYYQEPGINNQRDYSEGPQGTEYIDPFTGMLRLSYKDLVIPGNGGLDIVINRIYQLSPQKSGVVGFIPYHDGRTTTGMGWDMHFGRILYNGSLFPNGCATLNFYSDENPVLELPDGTKKVFFLKATSSNGPYVYITKDRWIGTCIDETVYGQRNGGMLVTSPNGVKYKINYKKNVKSSLNVWSTTRITDPSGNWINISHKSPTRTQYVEFDRITTSDSRTVVFTYLNAGTANTRLYRIAVNNQTWTYIYRKETGQALGYYFLDEVRGPESVMWKYKYFTRGQGLNSIQQVTSPTGGISSYTYQLRAFRYGLVSPIESTAIDKKVTYGTGVVSGTWSYVYSISANLDVTTVTRPTGTDIYRHCGETAFDRNLTNCRYNLGKLLSKEIFSGRTLLQKETYEWGAQKISDQREKFPTRVYYISDGVWADNLTRKITTLDGSTYTTTYSNYNIYGNLGRKSEIGPSSSRTTNYTYNNFTTSSAWIIGLPDRETITGVGVVNNDYYTTGNKIGRLRQVNRYGVITKYDYDSSGNVNRETDPRNNIKTYTNYYRGIPRNESHPELVRIRRTVNATGTIQSETNARSKRTSYTYDGINRLKSISTPRTDDSNVSISRSSGGRISTVTRGTFSSTTTKDGFGNTLRVQAEGITNTYRYNAENQLLFESNPSSTTKGETYLRDALGRTTRITHADNTYVRYEYLSLNRLRITDENNKKTTYTYKSYGNPNERYLIKVEAPEFSTTTINRDLIGNITSIVQGGVTRTYNLDSRKFLDTIINPETGTTKVSIDNSGNMTNKRVGSSATSLFNYDGLNRLDDINFPAGTNDVDYIYDKNSNITNINSTSANWNYVYDDNDNLKEENSTINGVTRKITYTYDTRDNLSSVTYPNGLIVNYSPDDLGRPTQASGFVKSPISYHPDFQIKDIRYNNNIATTMSLSTDNRLRPARFNTGAVADISYGYDNAGNINTFKDNRDALNNRTMTYDGINRLKTLSGAWGGGSINYSRDGDINSKNVDGVNLTYTYNASNNRLTSISGSKTYTFAYDVYGNVTRNGQDTFTEN